MLAKHFVQVKGWCMVTDVLDLNLTHSWPAQNVHFLEPLMSEFHPPFIMFYMGMNKNMKQ